MKRINFGVYGLALVLILAGCSSTSPLIPNKTLQLTSKYSISLATLAKGALIVGAIQLIYDPLAPNWEIEEARISEDTYRFSMTMKRYHTGGAGESIQILKRRASQLQAEQGYSTYMLMEYTEGIDSQTLGARRVAEGTIKLVQRQQADSFMQN
jgi:hypothetical protein